MTNIEAVIYSYKNKNLKVVVEALLSNTANNIFINIFDQNPIDRSSFFTASNIKYEHIIWDKIESPSEKKGDIINRSNADYILELSDDCLVSKNWDASLIGFMIQHNCVISGNEPIEIFKKDFFSIGKRAVEPINIKKNNYISRNFIFTTKAIWNSVQYPYYLKFNGEEELLSLNFFKAGYDIYNAPAETYTNLKLNTLENLYVPFSKDHNYNIVVDIINEVEGPAQRNTPRTKQDFLDFHNLNNLKLAKLPYPTNDVEYDQYGLKFQDIDARKFISRTKSIY